MYRYSFVLVLVLDCYLSLGSGLRKTGMEGGFRVYPIGSTAEFTRVVTAGDPGLGWMIGCLAPHM